jgi:hypothetical protein
MSTEHLVPPDLRDIYHVKQWRNAAGVLTTACPKEWEEIVTILRNFRLLRSEIQAGTVLQFPNSSTGLSMPLVGRRRKRQADPIWRTLGE